MRASPQNELPSAVQVEPRSIELRAPSGDGCELLVRSRPPGAVQLDGGQRDHMLLCSSGRSVPGVESRSVLRTEDGVTEWTHAPRWHVTFIPAGMPIEWEWSYHSDSVHLILEPSHFEAMREEVAERSGSELALRPILRRAHEPLRQVLHELRDEAEAGGTGRDLAMSSLSSLAALHVLRAVEVDERRSERAAPRLLDRELRRALELIDERLGESLTLDEIARACGLSTYHFARAFKGAVGVPPHEYQLRRRVERAKELLVARPRRSVAEIACELGFSDESHLRRHFKRVVGTTPGQFRR